MQLPCIHPNGTSKTTLLSDLASVQIALDAAYEALKQTAPNGRDYYPLGPAAMEKAMAEHTARLKKLDELMSEIGALQLGIEFTGE